MPSAPAWQKKPTWPRPGEAGASVALSRISGSVLMTPRQLGPTTRMPLARAVATTWRCRASPSAPDLGEAAGDDDQPLHPLARAVLDDLEHGRGGRGHQGEVDLAGDVGDPQVGGPAADLAARSVDRVHLAGEVAGQARCPAAAGRSSPRSRLAPTTATSAGYEQPLDRPRLGAVLAGPHHRLGQLGALDREAQPHHAVAVLASGDVAGVGEHPDHAPVARAAPRPESCRCRARGQRRPGARAGPSPGRVPGGRPRRRRRPRPRRCRAAGRSAPRATISPPSSATMATRSWWSTVTNRLDLGRA